MKPFRSLTITAWIFLGVILASHLHVNYAQSATINNLDQLRSEWVGQYPHKGKSFFLNEPRIKKPLQQFLNKDRFAALVAGDYLETPIDYVAGYYVVSFASNLHLMQKEEWVYVIVREHTGSVHTAVKDSANRVQWNPSGENDIPLQILKMLDLSAPKK